MIDKRKVNKYIKKNLKNLLKQELKQEVKKNIKHYKEEEQVAKGKKTKKSNTNNKENILYI